MDRPLLREQSPAEFFRDHIEGALARQHLAAGGLTSYYLVELLCRFVSPETRIPFNDDHGQPLALRLARALEVDGLERRARLRNLADFSLFVSGFYSDSLHRRFVDVDYYVSMGEYAYASLARREEDALGEVYAELGRRFVPFMDVLTDVSEQTGQSRGRDVLRIYERWLRTGSSLAARQLASRGIYPNASIGRRFLQ
ncbi:MAG TPA: hypothetical protein VGI12_16495 [Vicinamibacterales bacterium]|jgi:hypothetical protein